MKIPRFYQHQSIEIQQTIKLSDVNHRHAIQVLRLKIESRIILFNGKGGEYLARLTEANKRSSEVFIESFNEIDRESPIRLRLVLAMIKPEKMDFAIQKAVELGVNEIQPFYSRRSVIKIKTNRLEKKLQHWDGVIKSACEQSGRTIIPQILESKSLIELFEDNKNEMKVIMLPGNYPDFSQLKKSDEQTTISLIIGPEGGFSDDEEQQILDKKVTPVSFGPRILRAETAVIAGITACQQRWGDL